MNEKLVSYKAAKALSEITEEPTEHEKALAEFVIRFALDDVREFFKAHGWDRLAYELGRYMITLESRSSRGL